MVPPGSFRDNDTEAVSPLVIDVTDVTLPDFKVRRGEDRFWSAGEEEGDCGDAGMEMSLGVSTGLCPKDESEPGDRPGGSLGLGVRAGERVGFAASDGVCLELRLGLGVISSGEVGVFNEETEDRVLMEMEDGGDDPRLIKAGLRPGSRSWLDLGSGGVWVTGKSGLV